MERFLFHERVCFTLRKSNLDVSATPAGVRIIDEHNDYIIPHENASRVHTHTLT